MRRTRSAVGTALLAVVSLGAPSAAYAPPVPLAHPPRTRVERAAHRCQHDPPGDEGRPNPGAGPGPGLRRAGRGLRRPTAFRLRRRCPPQPDGRDAGAGRARGRLPELRVRQHALVAPELAGVGVRPAQHLRPPGGDVRALLLATPPGKSPRSRSSASPFVRALVCPLNSPPPSRPGGCGSTRRRPGRRTAPVSGPGWSRAGSTPGRSSTRPGARRRRR
jgi:hypothetical protein